MEDWKKVSGSTLKLLAVITMFIDHLALVVIARMIRIAPLGDQLIRLKSLYSLMRAVGRLAFPIFCFLLVVGFDKTRSKKKYLFRLALFALISEIPYDLAFSAKVLEFNHQNVYFTLFFGLLALCAYMWLKDHKLPLPARRFICFLGAAVCAAWMTKFSRQYVQRYILDKIPKSMIFSDTVTAMAIFFAICAGVAIFLLGCRVRMGADKMLSIGEDLAALFLIMTLADLLHTDYSGMGVLTITVMYIMRKHDVLAMLGGCVVLTLKSLFELPAFWTLFPIAMYNGKRGLKLKYFFYIFYPAHLLLLWLTAWLMGTAFIPVF